ncbi:hypothetical protein ACFQ48_14700 [Hymenobacter caeli]|uniref:PepSY domain-containing protein n=1 Tax=Hymenobacter caeli TaxID=2735894 RepID=A0ABX2FSJ9_9BACT|nr:hypothetical protein [Hymenobacter caeli]NRT20172.1 hypothetical protein [Hymenobacter caeli]
MHFYLPRRYRRPLLFPPGLLALAGLLWLGCVALGPWREWLKLKSVMQLTMPVLPLSKHSETGPFILPSSAKVRSMGPWRDNYITGKPEGKAHEYAGITNDVRTMMADSAHHGGVRVRFAPTAHYKDLVFVLDLMNREKSKRYWLDIINKPVTFYTIVKPRHRGDYEFGSDVVWTRYTAPQIPLWTRLTDINNWWPLFQIHTESWQMLLQPEWRASMWFLAAIVALGGWRIMGPRRSTQTP